MADPGFPTGAPAPEFGTKTYYLARFLPTTTWKWKESHRGRPKPPFPLDPPMRDISDVLPISIFTARKCSLREGYVFTGVCDSVNRGGVRGFIGGHAWFYAGDAWFYAGGMCGFIWGVCMVLFGGVHGFILGGHAWFFFPVFSDTMRYGQLAGGTHPTGMHSCLTFITTRKQSLQKLCFHGCLCPEGGSGHAWHSCPSPSPGMHASRRWILRYALNERAVRILLECILVGNHFSS